MKRLILLAGLVALSACKTQISSDLFTSDIIAATEGEAVTAPIVIAMQAPGEPQCLESAPVVAQAVASQMGDVEFIGCEKIEYQDFARFRAQAPILPFDGQTPEPSTAFAFGVTVKDGAYDVRYLVNPDAVKGIWDALPEDMTQYRTFEFKPELTAVLNNDLRKPVEITVDDVFADGYPVQGTGSRELPRRDQSEIVMSNVTNAAFGVAQNFAHIVTFSEVE